MDFPTAYCLLPTASFEFPPGSGRWWRPGITHCWLASVLLVVLAGVPAHADDAPAPGPVTVRARVEPDTVTIGQRFRYTLEVTTTPDVELMLAQPTETLGDFEIVDFGDLPAAERDGKAVVTRWFTLVGYSPGEHWLDSPPVRYRRPPAPALRHSRR